MLYHHVAGAAGKAASKQEEKQCGEKMYLVKYKERKRGFLGDKWLERQELVDNSRWIELNKELIKKKFPESDIKHLYVVEVVEKTSETKQAEAVNQPQTESKAESKQSSNPQSESKETKVETMQIEKKTSETKQSETSKQGRWLPAKVVSKVACKKCEVRIQVYEKISNCGKCVWQEVGCPIVVNRNSEKLAHFESPCKGPCEDDKDSFKEHVRAESRRKRS